MNILVGKTVTAIYLADDKLAIKFDVEDREPIVAKVDADCCSHTWIENVENHEAVVGSPILAVEDLELPDDTTEETEDGRILHYGVQITTAKGTCTIDYRNESNGYYGGSMWWPREDDSYNSFYGGVYDQNVSKEVWKPL